MSFELRLKYEAVPANASRFAGDMVEAAKSVDGTTLDYSPDSLAKVDGIVEGFRREGLRPEQVGETLFGFGCYVGEVFVRHASGQWRSTAETPMAGVASAPFLIQIEGEYVNPIDRVFRRLENGSEDDLTYFYRVFHRGTSAPPPDAEPPKRRGPFGFLKRG